MMHSTKAYLERLSTQKLEQFLHQCEHGVLAKEYAYIIPDVQRILERRRQAQEHSSSEDDKLERAQEFG